MHINRAKQVLAEGGIALGYGVRFFGGGEVARFLASAGYDFMFIDAEHSHFNLETITALCRAGIEADIAPIVRVCGLEAHLSSRVLDNGAMGLIFPHIEEVEEVRAIERMVYFPPQGKRSLAGPSAINDYRPAPALEMMRALEDETLVVIMVESARAVENLDALLSLGVAHVALIGSNDLMAELGVPGQKDHPEVEAAFRRVIEVCRRHDVAPGMGGLYELETLEKWIKAGMRFLYCANDGEFLIRAPAEKAAALRDIMTRAKS